MKSLHAYFKRFTLTTPLAILIGAAMIGVSVICYGFIVASTTPSTPLQLFSGKAIDSLDYVEGNAKSDVIIMEYSDPECPYCVGVYTTLKQLRTEYGDKVAFVYRHFPLTQIHPHAFDEARAIACAGTVGGSKKYFEYMDALFGFKSTNQTTELPVTGKEDLAKGVGLDLSAFTSCMQSPESSSGMYADINDGVAAGVEGTPTTFILKKSRKGYEVVAAVSGAQSQAYFKAAIDQALAD
jgi:protein-disulfide isomerase